MAKKKQTEAKAAQIAALKADQTRRPLTRFELQMLIHRAGSRLEVLRMAMRGAAAQNGGDWGEEGQIMVPLLHQMDSIVGAIHDCAFALGGENWTAEDRKRELWEDRDADDAAPLAFAQAQERAA